MAVKRAIWGLSVHEEISKSGDLQVQSTESEEALRETGL